MFQSAEVGCFDVSKMPGSFPIKIGGFVLHDDTQIIHNSKRRHVMMMLGLAGDNIKIHTQFHVIE